MALAKVDMHAHILPREIPDWKAQFGYGGFIRLEPQADGSAKMMRDDGHFFRHVQQNCFDASCVVGELDAHGVAVQVLCTVPVMFSYWAQPQDGATIARYLNDDLAENIRQHPQRLIGLGTLPMQAPELAVVELERCMTQLGFAGVQIATHVGEQNLNEAALFPIFEAAQDLGAAILVHPWDMMAMDQMQRYWLPWLVGMPAEVSRALCSMIFGGVFERLPRLRVAFAHGGGAFPATIGRIEHGFNVRPDLVAVDNPVNPRAYLGKFWVDSGVHDPTMLDYVVNLLGTDKVMLGTDYPFPLGEWLDGRWRPGELIESMPWPEAKKQALLSENAFAWLGLNREDYL